jgi:hypothetical protein
MSPFEMEKMEKRPQKKRGRQAGLPCSATRIGAGVGGSGTGSSETHTLWTSEPPWKDPEWVKPEDSASDSDLGKG